MSIERFVLIYGIKHRGPTYRVRYSSTLFAYLVLLDKDLPWSLLPNSHREKTIIVSAPIERDGQQTLSVKQGYFQLTAIPPTTDRIDYRRVRKRWSRGIWFFELLGFDPRLSDRYNVNLGGLLPGKCRIHNNGILKRVNRCRAPLFGLDEWFG